MKEKATLWERLRRRGVVRVALSYLVIVWLLLQIGDVVLDPLGAPGWVMPTLIVLAAVGFPVALVLAWFLEFTPQGIEVDQLDQTAERPTVRGIRKYADVVIITALVITVAFLLARQEGLIPDDVEPPVVAVLPFEELDSSEDNHFGDGFAETLIQKLGMLDELVVLASSSTFEFRDSTVDLTEVSAKLGASVLLQGSMRRAGGLLRLEASLLDGSSRQLLWSESYRRPIEDVFRLQDQIANAVFSALDVRLTAHEVDRVAKPPTNSLAAYDTYLRASREALQSRDPERMPEALQYLYDAIELDPQFALAHATLVEALHLTASYRRWDTRWSDIAEEARIAAARAQALDPDLGEAYLAEAFVAGWDREEGLRNYSDQHLIALTEKALDLSPNDPNALKMLASLVDDPERKIGLITRAARIDPRSGIIRVNAAENYARLGDFDRAEAWLIDAASATDPYFRLAYKMLVEMNVWDAVRLDRGARWGRAFEATYPEDWASKLAYVRALIELGAWQEAEELLQNTRRLAAEGDEYMKWIETHQGQWLAYAQGDVDRAAQLAERHIREMLVPTPSWPDLSGQNSIYLTSFDLLALIDLNRGEPLPALERYRKANVDVENMAWWNWDKGSVRPAVMYAILHRYTGQPEVADRMLRELLARIADEPIHGQQGKGFTEFMVYAFLGETDAAIGSLRAAVDAGWLPGWWGLEHGAFDDNYAAVLQDPRFARLRDRLVQRVTELRESFHARPELPQDLLLEAGLAVSSGAAGQLGSTH